MYHSLVPPTRAFPTKVGITTIVACLVLAPALVAATTRTTLIPIDELEHCGPVSLFVLGKLLGIDWKLGDVRAECQIQPDGSVTADELRRTANSLGLHLEVVRCSPGDLDRFAPCILHFRERQGRRPHFCVVSRRQGTNVLVLDPPYPTHWMSEDELVDRWDGVVLVRAARSTDDSRSQGGMWMRVALGAAAFCVGVGLQLFARRRRPPG